MSTFLIVLHVFVSVLLVLVVLMQAGKDGGIGTMGGGSSQSVFGSSGGANFFTKFTSGAAAVFMLTSIALTVVKGGRRSSIFDAPSAQASQQNKNTAPAAPAAPAASAAPVSPAKK